MVLKLGVEPHVALLGSVVIGNGVAKDGKEPSFEALGIAQRLKLVERPSERGLHHILSIACRNATSRERQPAFARFTQTPGNARCVRPRPFYGGGIHHGSATATTAAAVACTVIACRAGALVTAIMSATRLLWLGCILLLG